MGSGAARIRTSAYMESWHVQGKDFLPLHYRAGSLFSKLNFFLKLAVVYSNFIYYTHKISLSSPYLISSEFGSNDMSILVLCLITLNVNSIRIHFCGRA